MVKRYPLGNASFEAVPDLKHFPSQAFKNLFIEGWSWFEACSLQIFQGKLRLGLVLAHTGSLVTGLAW